MNKKVLILFEESNPDSLPWPADLGGDLVKKLIDVVCETFEKINTDITTFNAYDQIIKLVDTDCTFDKLVTNLQDQTQQGNTIDLVILGHGGHYDGDETCGFLTMHDGVLLTADQTGSLTDGTPVKSIHSIKEQVGLVSLRMVYMCNCWGSLLNPAWIGIGAQVAIGPYHDDYMPEPMTTDFLVGWAQTGESASNAASNAFNASKAFYQANPVTFCLYTFSGWFDDSNLVVTGNANIDKNWLYPPIVIPKPTLPAEVTNLPPYLQEIVIAQPATPHSPTGFGTFPGAANIRYYAVWADNYCEAQRSLTILNSALLDPEQQSFMFLRFGPQDDTGKYRDMAVNTLNLQESIDGIHWISTVPFQAGSDSEGSYYWADMLLPNNESHELTYQFKLEGKDHAAHLAIRTPLGDEIEKDPTIKVTVETNNPPQYPFSANYAPGPDTTHKCVVDDAPQPDAYENNNTFETATPIDLSSTRAVELTDLSLYPSGDIDFFKIQLPDSQDSMRPKPSTSSSPGSKFAINKLASVKVLPDIPDIHNTLGTTITYWDACISIYIGFRDYGNGAPLPEVHVYDANRNEICNGDIYTSVDDPLTSSNGGVLFVRVSNSAPESIKYAASFGYSPCGSRTTQQGISGFDIQQYLLEPVDPYIYDLLHNPGDPVEDPGKAFSDIAGSLDYAAIDKTTGSSKNQAVSQFLLALGQSLLDFGCPDAFKVFQNAQQTAQKAGKKDLALAALKGQESILLTTKDEASLVNVRKQIKKLNIRPVIVKPSA